MQFLVALVFEEECYFTDSSHEMKKKTELKEVNLRGGDILQRACFLDRVYISGEKINPISGEGEVKKKMTP
jgi:hypothetical protein